MAKERLTKRAERSNEFSARRMLEAEQLMTGLLEERRVISNQAQR